MRVRYTPKAASELDAILAYIDSKSPQGALNVKMRIQVVVDLLSRQPQAGPIASKKPLRRIVATPYPYLIFYQVAANEVIIHGIRHAARKPIV